MNKTVTSQLCLLFAAFADRDMCLDASQPATVESDSGQGRLRSQLTELNESQQQQRDDAIAAKEKLFQSLLGELSSSISENGSRKVD